MKNFALVAAAVLTMTSYAALAENRCDSLTETSISAVAKLELRETHVDSLRASLPAQPSTRQKGELARATAELSRAARSVETLASEAVQMNCSVADLLVEEKSTTEEVVAAAEAPEDVETTGSVAPR